MAEMIYNRHYRDDNITVTNVGACPGSEAFLININRKNLLVDSGFSFCAENMIRNIKSALGGESLDYILLTHSHYDHASGIPYCRSHFIDAKLVSSEYAAKIISKPSAVETMRELNRSAADEHGVIEFEDKLDLLKVDITVREGDVIDLNGVSLQVIEAPGHTRCSTAFYIPQEKFLISCETIGCLIGDNDAIPCYLVGYGMTLDSINKILNLDVGKILVPHFGVLEGSTCKTYLNNVLPAAERLKNFIVTDYRQGKSIEEIIEHYEDVYYTEEVRRAQPPAAFRLNAKHLVPMIIRETAE